MPYIHNLPPWRRLRPDDESMYKQRRSFVKQLGLASIGAALAPGLLSSCTATQKQSGNATKSNTFDFPGMSDLYPAPRNERYTVNRPMTKEYDATHYNNYYEFITSNLPTIYEIYPNVDKFDTSDWQIEVKGHAENTGRFALGDLIKAMKLEERVYRFRCVERWSMTVPWTGFPLADLLNYFQPTSKATFIRFTTAAKVNQMPGIEMQDWYTWPYREGLRMDEAMNEVAFIATGIYGKPLPKQNGAPIRLVVPWKYGYKNIKSIIKIDFLNYQPKTFWNVANPREYPFISNVDPGVPHPRWSQAKEWRLPDQSQSFPTQKYNGYGEYVAKLYGG